MYFQTSHICLASNLASVTFQYPYLPSASFTLSTPLHLFSGPFLYLCLVALLQGAQVADEAHGQATPFLSLRILSQTVQQYPCVPGPSEQPQALPLWEVVWLQGRAERWSKGQRMFIFECVKAASNIRNDNFNPITFLQHVKFYLCFGVLKHRP